MRRGASSHDTFPIARPGEGRLESWKEIAAYLNRDVTTVQRWEKREGMPVHRHLHDRIGSVYAFRAELDGWARSRKFRAAEENEKSAPLPNPAVAPIRLAKSTFRIQKSSIVLLCAAALALLVGVSLRLHRTEYFWRSPIAEARFQTVTNFDGMGQAAAVSRDGHFVAFLSERAQQMDVWITQAGSGEFHNLTRGSVPGLVNNPDIRSLGFSPDGSLVTFWTSSQSGSGASNIGIWAVPTLGGQPRPYLEGAAEFDWSRDGSRLVYHTPGPGDPLFISEGGRRRGNRPLFTAPAGQHSHFPLWAPDTASIYIVRGSLPDKLDIWRIARKGGAPERITWLNTRVSHPVLLDRRTLLYLATNPDGSGPSLYSIDVERRIPHKLTSGPELYTSLAASSDGKRLVLTVTSPKRTLWHFGMGDSQRGAVPVPLSLTTSTGFSPRLGVDYLLYVCVTGTGESIWKVANGTSTELWNADGARLLGGPAISPDGRYVAFSVRQHEQSLLYVMRADGTNARIVSDSLNLQGAPAWAPDSHSITSAVEDHGVPHLFRFAVNGRAPAVFVREYSVDPAWAPDGHFVLYSGPDIGTKFSVKAATEKGGEQAIPALTITRGTRHLAFLPEGALVFLRGNVQHKDLWLIDLKSGSERQLTEVAPDFNIRDFDVSPNGREVVLERVQERSDVVLMDLPRR